VLESRVEVLRSRVEVLESRVEVLRSRVEVLENRVEVLRSRVGVLQTLSHRDQLHFKTVATHFYFLGKTYPVLTPLPIPRLSCSLST
ncbi:hypothetical protein, partial [Nostoc sp.]|uniref:hypothetical protein n=1 Tax=Nostoc sp. TaxID=1180 RepID=UPI002FFD14D0